MKSAATSDQRFDAWLAAIDQRHLSDLTPSEVARALRALSSCYVERRSKLTRGAALGTAGKRAAFALFYAPVHFLIARQIVRALALDRVRLTQLLDLGCGTGAAGAAWALDASGVRIAGVDRHPWAVAEANWSYQQLSIPGRAVQLDVLRARLAASAEAGILAAYAVNELQDSGRAELLPRLIAAAARGAHVLVIEPVARRVTPWWSPWESAFLEGGGRADEWRFPAHLPPRQRDLAKAAGLDPRELTARSLYVGGSEPTASAGRARQPK
jgi:hypothetical protein